MLDLITCYILGAHYNSIFAAQYQTATIATKEYCTAKNISYFSAYIPVQIPFLANDLSLNTV